MTDLSHIAVAFKSTFDYGHERAETIKWLRGHIALLEWRLKLTQAGTNRSVINDRIASAKVALMRAEQELRDL